MVSAVGGCEEGLAIDTDLVNLDKVDTVHRIQDVLVSLDGNFGLVQQALAGEVDYSALIQSPGYQGLEAKYQASLYILYLQQLLICYLNQFWNSCGYDQNVAWKEKSKLLGRIQSTDSQPGLSPLLGAVAVLNDVSQSFLVRKMGVYQPLLICLSSLLTFTKGGAWISPDFSSLQSQMLGSPCAGSPVLVPVNILYESPTRQGYLRAPNGIILSIPGAVAGAFFSFPYGFPSVSLGQFLDQSLGQLQESQLYPFCCWVYDLVRSTTVELDYSPGSTNIPIYQYYPYPYEAIYYYAQSSIPFGSTISSFPPLLTLSTVVSRPSTDVPTLTIYGNPSNLGVSPVIQFVDGPPIGCPTVGDLLAAASVAFQDPTPSDQAALHWNWSTEAWETSATTDPIAQYDFYALSFTTPMVGPLTLTFQNSAITHTVVESAYRAGNPLLAPTLWQSIG